LRWIGGDAAGTDAHRSYWARPDLDYWPRVWAARALRYVWAALAEPAVIVGLEDPAWRVREHCCALARSQQIAAAANRLAALADADVEDTPRVRVAAIKALAVVGEYEHSEALRLALHDPERPVRDAAEGALLRLAERLDRPID
jgi:HEAT repeat protein